jgi:hypothetical protein
VIGVVLIACGVLSMIGRAAQRSAVAPTAVAQVAVAPKAQTPTRRVTATPVSSATPVPSATPAATVPPSPTTERDNSIEAGIMCEDFVKDRLKSPSTAEFASIIANGVTVVKDGKQYHMRSWVDSQNGFGAMLRTRFSCTVADQGAGDWKLITLEFDK